MLTRRRRLFLNGQIAWMLSVIVLLTLFDALSPELFFLLSLIGLLIVTELTAPVNVTPEWRRRLRWIILVGLAVFGYIVARWLVEVIPWELL
ncbi:hypothetical protein [Natronorarus salvus]|uniref:hypothetical protein n=1 Tax=Natronorarus salvus TaxID=3117733 RepID=UPI002F266758